MAVGLHFPEAMHPVAGVTLASCDAGVNRRAGDDMVLIACEPGTRSAAVFTQNAFCAAPVQVARAHHQQVPPRYLVVNTGSANAGTGAQGLSNAHACCEQLAAQTSVDSRSVLPFSTGVINQQLNMPRMQSGINTLPAALDTDNWRAAAHGILTTDTAPKGFSEVIEIDDGVAITVTGISKGSGMICPNMATMLAFIATDAPVAEASLQTLLEDAITRSFNSITVDGDTSTNDACVLLATGKAGGSELDETHPQWAQFADCVQRACTALAQAIIRDGEGATKFISVAINGGRNAQECRQVAYTIAHSPLVKTAFYASDANVGRLLAAVGRSGLENLDISTVSMAIDEVDIVIGGEPASDYSEARGQQVMSREEITVSVALGRGESEWTVWTTDLSNEYVRINAEYRS